MTGLTREFAREIDRRAVDEYGMSSLVLMENAGRGVCDRLFQFGIRGPVAICCGPGNNGGDGFVVARHLDLRYATVKVGVFAELARYQGDAAHNLAILQKTGVPIEVFGTSFETARLEQFLCGAGYVVDALLGTGFQGQVREPIASAIDTINASGVPVIAVDLPSGLDCDRGEPATHTIRARHTLTFVAPKRGFSSPTAQTYLGAVHVLDIGAPRRLVEEIVSRAERSKGNGDATY